MNRPDRNNSYVLCRYKHTKWKIEESGFDSLHRLEDSPFLRRVQTDFGAQPSTYSMGAKNTVTRSQEGAGIHLRLEPRLKMSEAISQLLHMPSWNVQKSFLPLSTVILKILTYNVTL